MLTTLLPSMPKITETNTVLLKNKRKNLSRWKSTHRISKTIRFYTIRRTRSSVHDRRETQWLRNLHDGSRRPSSRSKSTYDTSSDPYKIHGKDVSTDHRKNGCAVSDGVIICSPFRYGLALREANLVIRYKRNFNGSPYLSTDLSGKCRH